MYYVFLIIYIYQIQNNTGSLQLCLRQVTSREDFQASTKGFDTILSPQIFFCTMILYDTYIYFIHACMLSYSIMFSTSQRSRLGTFKVYFFCSLIMLYSHSSHFYPFQARCYYCSYSSVLLWNSQSSSRLQVIFLLAYSLDRFYKPPCLYVILYCFEIIYVLHILRVFDTVWYAGYSKRDMC